MNDVTVSDIRRETVNDVCEWLGRNAVHYDESREELVCDVDLDTLKNDVIGDNEFPSDETIMLILNCVGYEEESWVEFVRKRLKENEKTGK